MTKYYLTEDELTALPRIVPYRNTNIPNEGDLVVRLSGGSHLFMRAGTVCRVLRVRPGTGGVDVQPLDPDNLAGTDGYGLDYFALYTETEHEPL